MGKYKWFNKMKDSKGKKDYSKMSQEELREEARKIEVIDDDGSVVTIGELIERDNAKNNSINNSIPQKDSKSDNNDNNNIDNIFENIEEVKKYSDEYSKQNECL